MNNEITGCGVQLNPNGSDARCGQVSSALPFGGKQLCVSCQDKARIHHLEQALKDKPLVAQVSALDIQPGNMVVLRVDALATPDSIQPLVESVRHVVPQGCTIAVLVGDADITALTDESMRAQGWVRWSTVEPLVGCAELLADNLRRDAENTSDNDEGDFERKGILRHADKVDALVRQVKGTQPELPL